MKYLKTMDNTEQKFQQWEYHRLYMDEMENILERLDSVGERGWELVASYPTNAPRYNWFIFKRPKTQDNV